MPKYSQEELQQIDERTKKIEEERRERDRVREEKKQLKAIQQKRKTWEKLVAPILLVITIILTLLIRVFWQN